MTPTRRPPSPPLTLVAAYPPESHVRLIQVGPLPLLLLSSLVTSACVPTPWPEDSGFPVGQAVATAAGNLAGTVTDTDGVPLSGVNVTTDPSGRGAVTDADGGYVIERLLPGSYRVVANVDGFVAGWSEAVDVTAETVAEADVQLAPAEVVDGFVTISVNGPDGLPAVGASVIGTDGTTSATATTDAAGEAVLSGLGGLTVSVEVLDPTGRLASRHVNVLSVPALGNAALSLQLSGMPGASATYIGSTICGYCHTDQGSNHALNAHAGAQSALTGAPAAGFDSAQVVDLGSASATLGWSGAVATVVLTDDTGSARSYTVSGLLGGEARGAVPWTEIAGTAWPLPLAWTAPDPSRSGWPGAAGGWTAWQTEVWFDAGGSFSFASDGSPAMSSSAETRCFACHATGFSLAAAGGGALAMTASTGTGRWVEGDVGCERCHGPGSEHSSGALSQKPFTIVNPDFLDVDRANEVCGQCHSALAGGEGAPYAWDADHGLFTPGNTLADYAGTAFVTWSGGAAAVPGAQADELLASPHGTGDWVARCTDCHDPHGDPGAVAGMLRQSDVDNTACLSCHSALSFDADEATVISHTGHPIYAPESPPGEGRCVGCHMSQTATRLVWNDESAAGTEMSHMFLAVPPSETIADFDAASATELPPGSFVTNSCIECHVYNAWLFGGGFPGPTGDPTLRTTHVALDAAWTEMYP